MEKVAILSRADASGGGASRVADDLRDGFVASDHFTIQRFAEEISPALRHAYLPVRRSSPFLYRKAHRLLTQQGYVDHVPLDLHLLHHDLLAAQIVHAHDISATTTPATLDRLVSAGRRVIWTLHDMSPITGGCLYPIGCDAWQQTCGQCPTLGQWPLMTRKDRTAILQARRLAVIASGRIDLVSPSRWLADLVENHVPGSRVRVIPNGVDTAMFSPAAPEPPTDQLRMIFVANHITDLRKGGPYIGEISRWLADNGRKLTLSVIGGGTTGSIVERGNLRLHYMGRVTDRRKLAALYAECHGLLLPTHADNFPLVMLESMACGVPVFGFDTGGIREAVSPAEGSIRPQGRIDLLLADFFHAVDSGRVNEMRIACRHAAESRYSLRDFISAHKALYEVERMPAAATLLQA